jgi:hypothetical protein
VTFTKETALCRLARAVQAARAMLEGDPLDPEPEGFEEALMACLLWERRAAELGASQEEINGAYDP